MSFRVFSLRNVGVLTDDYKEFTNRKKRNIYSCTAIKNGCVLECIYISTHENQYKSLKGYKRMIEARIEEQYKEIYGKPLPKDYAGEPTEATLLECSNKYNILYKVYAIRTPENTSKDSKETNSEREYEKISSFRPSVFDCFSVTSCEGDELFNYNTNIDDEEEIVEKYNKENPDKKIKICNLLFLSKESSESNNFEDKNHLMYIIDFEKFTKCHVCLKCGNYCL
jgi:hypothetical protein